MKLELQFNSVQIDPQDLQEYLPKIISAMQLYPVPSKKRKRRKRKKKETVGPLIQEIIDNIE